MLRKKVFSLKFLLNSLHELAKQFSVFKNLTLPLGAKVYVPRENKGFALLITLVVVSVILAVSLSLLFVTTKQYMLAITANESEEAFQAAQIGLECMRYWRNQPTTRSQFLREGGNWPPSVECAGQNPNIPPGVQAATLFNDSGRFLYSYEYQYDMGGISCSEPSIYIADMREATSDLSYSLSGEGLGEIECTAGTICTAVFARGYNRPCDQLNDSIFTIQREITIEY